MDINSQLCLLITNICLLLMINYGLWHSGSHVSPGRAQAVRSSTQAWLLTSTKPRAGAGRTPPGEQVRPPSREQHKVSPPETLKSKGLQNCYLKYSQRLPLKQRPKGFSCHQLTYPNPRNDFLNPSSPSKSSIER